MAITYLGKRAGDAQKNGFSATGASIVYLYVATAGEDATQIINQSEIPAYKSAHPFAPNLVCTEISCSKAEGSETKATHEVTASYSEPDGSTVDPRHSDTKPWELPVASFSILPVDNVVPFEKAYQKGDTLGSPSKSVLSSAKTPLGANTNKSNLILRFSYNIQDIHDS